jgi:D-alanyl-D-alanine carboxypeptidase/D-alanyl-D-alanine-endopeptidase (penicillin-binding protein 4)
VDADGRLLVFVVMSDEVPVGGTTLARRASDKVAAALTACGCR